MVTNSRNSSIFSNNMIEANTQLGNNTDIFELDYNQSVQKERERLLTVIESKAIDIVLFLNDFRFPNQSFFLNEISPSFCILLSSFERALRSTPK